MNLTKNITLEELTASDDAVKHGIVNVPDEAQLQNLTMLAVNILQPIRDHFDKPVIVGPHHSGFRCDKLNEIVGGEPKSQHRKGQAADFHVEDIPLKEVFLFIIRDLRFDQVIFEFGRWIHCSYNPLNNRNQKLVGKKIDGKTQYLPYHSVDQLQS